MTNDITVVLADDHAVVCKGPGGSSLEAISTILEQAPETAIVVLTRQNDPSFARLATQPAEPAGPSSHTAPTSSRRRAGPRGPSSCATRSSTGSST